VQPGFGKRPLVILRIVGILTVTAAGIWYLNTPSKTHAPSNIEAEPTPSREPAQTSNAPVPDDTAVPRPIPAATVADDPAVLNDAEALDMNMALKRFCVARPVPTTI